MKKYFKNIFYKIKEHIINFCNKKININRDISLDTDIEIKNCSDIRKDKTL